MTWVRFDDEFPIHRKLGPLDDATYRLHSEAIFWCSRNTTDGRIAREELPAISVRAKTARVAKLVARNLWHAAGSQRCGSEKCPTPGPDGWVIHDYLDYQPARDKVLADREAKAERQRNWLERKRHKRDASPDTPRDSPGDVAEDALLTLPPSPTPLPKGSGGGSSPEATAPRLSAADGSGGGQRPKPTRDDPGPGPEDPAVIEADRRRLEALAAHQESLNLEAEERTRRGAAAARAALPPGRQKPQVRRPNPVFVEAVDNPHYDPKATLNGGAA